MGTIVCCGESNKYKSSNLHLYQINRYYSENSIAPKIDMSSQPLYPESQRNSEISDTLIKNSTEGSEIMGIDPNSNNIKKQYLKNKNGEFQLLCYDIVQETFTDFKIIFPIIKSIEGLSELTIKSNFYLCGISSKQKNEGSFLFKINLNLINDNNELNAEILINSTSQHVYPSLISDQSGQIICVGGKKQKQCELFNSNLNKWFLLPELPEERYKCTLCIDPKNIFVYLFGGINTENKNKNKEIEQENDYKILRMDLIKQLIWESLPIKIDSKNIIINRLSAASFAFKNDEDFIFIAGGKDKDNNTYLDDIIRFSIRELKFESTSIKLKNKSIFMNQYPILNDDQTCYFIDSLNQIDSIDRHDCLPINYLPEEI